MPDKTPGLLDALLAVQAEPLTIPKDGTNPAFGGSGYTTLATLVERVAPVLTKHELIWTTLPVSGVHGPALLYRLAHVPTGQALEGEMPLLLGKADSQGLGSAITYARRYSLCAVLNLVADDDDDGNGASEKRTTGDGHYPSDKPTDKQMKELSRQVKIHKPPSKTLAAMLLSVRAQGVKAADLESGAWASKVTKAQVSDLIDMFVSGTLPTGESDIPSDLEPEPEFNGEGIPFDAVGAEQS